MESQTFDRLIKEQERGVAHTENDVRKLEGYRAEYADLIPKLLELQKSVTKPAYLPFGRRALVPGRLIHTNELLVHLGGDANHFAQLSTHQTVKLIDRRIAGIDSRLDEMKSQKKLIQDRLDYTRNLIDQPRRIITDPDDQNNATPNDEEGCEIREAYDSDAEAEWRELHKASRARERQSLQRAATPPLLDRKVRFHVPSADASSSSDASDYELDPLVYIHFRHSDVPSAQCRRLISDPSTMTLAEASDVAVGLSKLRESSEATNSAPFGGVVERSVVSTSCDVKSSSPAAVTPVARQSRFKKARSK